MEKNLEGNALERGYLYDDSNWDKLRTRFLLEAACLQQDSGGKAVIKDFFPNTDFAKDPGAEIITAPVTLNGQTVNVPSGVRIRDLSLLNRFRMRCTVVAHIPKESIGQIKVEQLADVFPFNEVDDNEGGKWISWAHLTGENKNDLPTSLAGVEIFPVVPSLGVMADHAVATSMVGIKGST